MGILVYAEAADLAAWVDPSSGVAPSNATALLRSASLLVRKATRSAVYEVDADYYPSDDDIRQAFRDATCAHACALDAAGVDPLAAGTDPQLSSTSIGSASVSYAGAEQAATARLRLSQVLCEEAQQILADAGMFGCPPMQYRDAPPADWTPA